mgnify:CR=1 FL=1|jgi:hypothetical protein|tara:strand:- start:8825 stop:9103 length:279 start_codon:yes stop_codon:yes gene_type:complete
MKLPSTPAQDANEFFRAVADKVTKQSPHGDYMQEPIHRQLERITLDLRLMEQAQRLPDTDWTEVIDYAVRIGAECMKITGNAMRDLQEDADG